jgi:hypothetical protein
MASAQFLVDIESSPFTEGVMHVVVITDKSTAFDLVWTDAAFHDAAPDVTISEFERRRRFKHCGAAIAWARRQIFHGAVFGDAIEMQTISLWRADGRPQEEHVKSVEITLQGFCDWSEGTARLSPSYRDHRSVRLAPPSRKCRTGLSE